jgi:hypothetical protein
LLAQLRPAAGAGFVADAIELVQSAGSPRRPERLAPENARLGPARGSGGGTGWNALLYETCGRHAWRPDHRTEKGPIMIIRRALRRRSIWVVVASALLLARLPGAARADVILTDAHMHNFHSSKCLDVRAEEDFNAPGAHVQQWDCHDVLEQVWWWWDVGQIEGQFYFEIVSKRSGLCMDVVDTVPSDGGNGKKIVQSPCIGTRTMEWRINSTNPNEGTFTLANLNSGPGKCLEITGGRKDNGVLAQMWDCNGTEAQRWFLTTPA